MTSQRMGPPVEDSEFLSRFIVDKKQVSGRNTNDPRVKPAAFIPAKNGQTSVFRQTGIPETKLWSLGEEVARLRGRSLYGRADVTAREVRSASSQLLLIPDETPPNEPNHVNISGWPDDDAAKGMIATELAAAARFIITPHS